MSNNKLKTEREEINKEEETSLDFGKTLYSFNTVEFEVKERGTLWFIMLGAFILAGIIIGIFTEALSLVLISIMVGLVYTLTYNKQPEKILVEFTELGMKWRDQFFAYSDIKKFWIFYIPHEQKTLHVLVKKRNSQKEIIIPIGAHKINKIKDVLGYYVPEDEDFVEPISTALTRKLKL